MLRTGPSPDAPRSEPPRRSPWLRRGGLAAVALLLAALGAVWLFPGGQDAPTEPTVSSLPAQPATEPLPPPEAVPQDDLQADAAEEDEAPPPGTAYEPVPTSDNTNLSLARRAGLHRSANPLQLTASVALALDGRTGEVLYARNELAILPIASLTKLLTAMVLLDAGLPMSQSIRITRDDVDTLRNSRSRLRVGTSMTRAHALQLALMSSENRAAHALARTYPGGVQAFVAQMNRKAEQLGMADSRFADPTGLSNRNRATAQDVAKLVLAASKYPQVRRYTTTKRHLAEFPGRKLQYLNANRLVRHAGWPITVQKTGYIVEAGQCMAMLTRSAQGHSVVLVLMDAGSRTTRAQDARKLRGWAGQQVAKARRAGAAARAPAPAR